MYAESENLFKIIRRHCPSLRILTFTTNALKPESALALGLEVKRSAPDHFITVSLDGDEKTHDFVRGVKGNYEKAFETYELMKQNGLHVHFGLTSSKYNSAFIQSQYHEWSGKIKAISFAHSGGIYKTKNEVFSPLLQQSLKSLIRHYKVRNPGQFLEYLYLQLARRFFETQKLPIPCSVVSTSLHIRPNGDIHPCMFLPKLGNIRDADPAYFLNSPEAQRLRQKARNGDCQKCWMNCYAPHSIMRHPLKTALQLLWPRTHA